MNRLLYRLIPALLTLALPFNLQAAETGEPAIPATESGTQTSPENSETSAAIEDTATPAAETVVQETTAADNANPETTEPKVEAAGEAASTVVEPAAEKANDGTFNIAAFEIEGNNLLDTTTIEKALQRFLGEGRDRKDLFSIRSAVINTYRKAELKGVAVAVPSPAANNMVMIRIYEDDINAYPDQSKMRAPAAAVISRPAKTKPQTFAVASLPDDNTPTTQENPSRQLEVQQQIAASMAARTEADNSFQPVEQSNEAGEKPVPELAVSKSPEPAVEMPTVVSNEVEKPALQKPAATEAVQVVAEAAKPSEKRPSEKSIAKITEEKTSVVAKKKPVSHAEPVKAEQADNEMASDISAPARDARSGNFNIASFEVYGNSVVKTAAIDKLLEAHIGTGKSYADLVEAKTEISKLYRAKGYKMVAVGLPSRIFGEAIPIRIYEAGRNR
ncbi:POTRA domain-containing protein, ShlB-type [Mariprofundus ferrinatatus]|uniref:POTRA domain-containing protein, ShlB-type n=1 Tax=Mariprofundus ferrinatatus TaxID=1921087 RepID=A0A2K8L1W3_9PROT|nr:POTRA domain-containing protein [Mariprofundus ferrinatatus]ATX81233.1 POTRA domain-containing protein, ShlB-type [Mariprofundus ferrinatatus]